MISTNDNKERVLDEFGQNQRLDELAADVVAPDLPAWRRDEVSVPAVRSQTPLGERLVKGGVITRDELTAALTEQTICHRPIGEILLGLGFIEEEGLLPFLAEQLGVPGVRLREGLIDPSIVKIIPRVTAEALSAIALFRIRDELTVVMSDPGNLEQLDEIERVTGCRVRPVLALHSAIHKLLPRAYENDFGVDTVTADFDTEAVSLETETIEIDLQQVESMADGSPVINLVNYVIVHAVRQHASDIHVEAGLQHSTVRYRIDGQLREVLRPRREFHPAIVSRLKVMARLDIAEHRMPQDGRIHVSVEGREIDLRISTLPTVRGEKVVMRVLDRSSVTFNLDALGISESVLKDVRTMLSRPYGLVLVTGPTGSGKTTTLYSALELLKSVERNIVTVEDPVEYQLELINQIAVGGAARMTFANALRSILRQDPDVIMVGEIRDQETAEMAIQAALTGHLVLSTLHTNDAAGAVTRCLDMGVQPFKIAAALVGVIAQRLVRTVCPDCRVPYYPPAQTLDLIGYSGDRRRQFIRGEGCRPCFDTGFRGRTGVYEVLMATREVRELITRDPDLEKLRAINRKAGGASLLEEGLRLAEEGRTSLDEVIRVALVD